MACAAHFLIICDEARVQFWFKIEKPSFLRGNNGDFSLYLNLSSRDLGFCFDAKLIQQWHLN
jgi:hypothetical protein